MSRLLLPLIYLFIISCSEVEMPSALATLSSPNITILGIAQDAGYPQANCKKDCCADVWSGKRKRKKVSCIALVDPEHNQAWIFDATPDFKDQLFDLETAYPGIELAGIFLTHAHMGHYTGLMHLGREAMGADRIPVYAMPRMKNYLETNGPWSQLVRLNNIDLRGLKSDSTIQLNSTFKVSPMAVPHRDEYSETVGFSIQSDRSSALFIPDIDKWEKWDRDILQEIKKVDYAFLDGSFYQNGEIPGRDMSQIPHPFMEESIKRFSSLAEKEKNKIHFIHFNHTNPVLRSGSKASQAVNIAGFKIAIEGNQHEL